MMKALHLIGLLALVETRWVRSDYPPQSVNERELGEEGRQLQALLIRYIMTRNRQELDGKKELSAENNGTDSLEDHSSEVQTEGETRWVPNDSLLQSITDGESVDKGSQYEEHAISNFLRSLEERPVNQEIDWANSLRNRRLENYAKVAWTISPPTPEEWIALQKRSSLKHAVNNKSMLDRRGTKFKYIYVQSDGVISPKKTSSPYIEVAATLDVSDYALKVAATTVARMTKHMPPSIFHTLTIQAKVGLFTKAETLIVYPEYAGLATPPGCESSCSGHCAESCTFDGRKYSSLGGAGGIRAVVIDDNVLCNSKDLFDKKANILVHEFAHTIHSYGLSSFLIRRISESYAHAKAYSTWQKDAYSMANEMEYFAEASQSFFAADKLYYTTGGMNRCSVIVCQTEPEGRQHLKDKAPELYSILSEVYTNNRPSLPGNLGVCTQV